MPGDRTGLQPQRLYGHDVDREGTSSAEEPDLHRA
jgi:hypothetical protein